MRKRSITAHEYRTHKLLGKDYSLPPPHGPTLTNIELANSSAKITHCLRLTNSNSQFLDNNDSLTPPPHGPTLTNINPQFLGKGNSGTLPHESTHECRTHKLLDRNDSLTPPPHAPALTNINPQFLGKGNSGTLPHGPTLANVNSQFLDKHDSMTPPHDPAHEHQLTVSRRKLLTDSASRTPRSRTSTHKLHLTNPLTSINSQTPPHEPTREYLSRNFSTKIQSGLHLAKSLRRRFVLR